jgi:hydrogenase nickel incorporation protein HypB
MCVTCGCSSTDGVTISDPLASEGHVEGHAGIDSEHARAHALGLPHHHGHAIGAAALADASSAQRRYRALGALGASGTLSAGAAPAGGVAARGAHHEAEGQVRPPRHGPRSTIVLEQELLAKNQHLAERNRGWFASRQILALNLMSSPGSGKTTLLERTIRDVAGELVIEVIEGDQATLNDANRIRATGCKVVQINTGSGCHLDADMLARGLATLAPHDGCVLMIENVGNLVCPALFDLGERAKVVILSVTEGEDKPIKYPHMFQASRVMLLNKIDLLPHLRFDVERCIAYARQINPHIEVFQVSAETGEGMPAWYGWLRAEQGDTAGPGSL